MDDGVSAHFEVDLEPGGPFDAPWDPPTDRRRPHVKYNASRYVGRPLGIVTIRLSPYPYTRPQMFLNLPGASAA